MLSKPTKQEVTESISKGANYLLEVQHEDAGWGITETRESNPMDTSEALMGLIRSGVSLENGQVKRGLEYVKAMILKENAGLLVASRDYAWPIALLGEARAKLQNEFIQSVLWMLDDFRVKGKGWGTWKGDTSKVYDTSLILFAISKLQDLIPFSLAEPSNWLVSSQNNDKGLGAYEGAETALHSTCLSTFAIYRINPKEKAFLRSAVDFIASKQEADGSWPNTEEYLEIYKGERFLYYNTPWAIMSSLLYENLVSPKVDKGVAFLLRTQDSSGGWAPQRNEKISAYATGNSLMALSEYLSMT